MGEDTEVVSSHLPLRAVTSLGLNVQHALASVKTSMRKNKNGKSLNVANVVQVQSRILNGNIR